MLPEMPWQVGEPVVLPHGDGTATVLYFDLPFDHVCRVVEFYSYRTLGNMWVTQRQPVAHRLTREEIAWMDSPAALVRG